MPRASVSSRTSDTRSRRRRPSSLACSDEVVTFPLSTNADKYPGKPNQMVSTVCLRSVWQDALVDYVGRMMEEFDIDGVYVDSANMPFPCMNAAARVRGPAGRRHEGPGLPGIRRARHLSQTLCGCQGQEGRRDRGQPRLRLHEQRLRWLSQPATGMASNCRRPTSRRTPCPWIDSARSSWASNWGVPCDLLSYKLGSFRKSLAVSLPHDILVRFRQDEIPVDAGENEALLSQSIWRLADDFGRSQARFTPYYSPERPVGGLPPDWIASTYRHPSHGALVIVSNLGRAEQRATLKPDWKASRDRHSRSGAGRPDPQSHVAAERQPGVSAVRRLLAALTSGGVDLGILSRGKEPG